jgi:hypothetical protein
LTRAWRLVLPAVLGGMLAGVWIGARCARAAERRMRREGPNPEHVLKMLRRELKLNEDQAGKVRVILEAERPAFAAIKRDGEARMAALRDDIDSKVAPLLDDGQKKKLEGLRARWKQRSDAH